MLTSVQHKSFNLRLGCLEPAQTSLPLLVCKLEPLDATEQAVSSQTDKLSLKPTFACTVNVGF